MEQSHKYFDPSFTLNTNKRKKSYKGREKIRKDNKRKQQDEYFASLESTDNTNTPTPEKHEVKDYENINSIATDVNNKIYREHLKDPKYKTELCKNYSKLGKCSYKSKCRYAHGENELISKNLSNKNYKKTRCDKFHNTGYCPYGQRCQFLHYDRTTEDALSVFRNTHYSFLLDSFMVKDYEHLGIIDDLVFTEHKNTHLQDENEYENNHLVYYYDQQRRLKTQDEKTKTSKRLSVFKDISNFNQENYFNSFSANTLPFYLSMRYYSLCYQQQQNDTLNNITITSNKKNFAVKDRKDSATTEESSFIKSCNSSQKHNGNFKKNSSERERFVSLYSDF